MITGAALLLLLTTSLLSGCMSFSKVDEKEITNILILIAEGRHEELTEMSSKSFLLDGEILHGIVLTGSFWRGLSEARFSLSGVKIIRNEALTDADTGLFGKTADVKVFFSKYTAEHSVIIELDSREGRTFMVLSPETGGIRKITAWGGPY